MQDLCIFININILNIRSVVYNCHHSTAMMTAIKTDIHHTFESTNALLCRKKTWAQAAHLFRSFSGQPT